jgi:hypothetical protein
LSMNGIDFDITAVHLGRVEQTWAIADADPVKDETGTADVVAKANMVECVWDRWVGVEFGGAGVGCSHRELGRWRKSLAFYSGVWGWCAGRPAAKTLKAGDLSWIFGLVLDWESRTGAPSRSTIN